MLVVELPVVGPADAHTVPIEPGRRSRRRRGGES